MTIHLRLVLIISIVFYFILILRLIKQKRLLLKYTLLWIASGLAMALLVLFPQLLDFFVKMIGVQTPMYGLFLAILVFVIFVLMSLTVIVSALNNRIKNLTQKIALYEKRIRELEQDNGEI